MEDRIWRFNDYCGFLKSEKVNVRKWALRRCIDLFGAEARREVAVMINDPEDEIAVPAVIYVGEHGLREYALPVLKRFNNSSGKLAGQCASALGKLQYEEAVPFFKARLDKSEFDANEFLGIVCALGDLQTADGLRVLLKIINKGRLNRYEGMFLSEAYLSAFKYNHRDVSRETLKDALLSLDCIEDDKDKERWLLGMAGHFVNPDILECLRFYAGQDGQDLGARIYEALGLEAFDPNSAEIIKRLNAPLNKAACLDLVRRLNLLHSAQSPDTPAQDARMDFKQGSLLFLSSLKHASDIIAKQPADIRALACFCALAAHLSILEHECFHICDDQENLRRLFTREVKFRPDFEAGLLEHMSARSDYALDLCRDLIETGPDSMAAVRAAELLGKMGQPEAIPALVRALSHKGSDFLYEEAISALKRMRKQAVVTHLAEVLDHGDSSSIIAALEVLEDYPVRETAGLALKHFEKLWINYNEQLLGLIEHTAAADFIEPLKKEVKPGEFYAQEVYLLLCDLHGVHDPRLEDIRRQERELKAKRERRDKVLMGPASESTMAELMDETIRLELKCKRCLRTYHYPVSRAYVNAENPSQDGVYIDQTIQCKNCGITDEYELTPMAYMALMTEMTKLMYAAEQGRAEEYTGPLKIAYVTQLADGTRATPWEALEIYRRRIREDPQNPENYLRLGNVLSAMDKLPQAAEQYRQAIKTNPLECEAYIGLLNVFMKEEKWDKAESARDKLLELIARRQGVWRSPNKEELKRKVINSSYSSAPRPNLKVVETVRKEPKVGRNQPCPCGSGRKYKKCCGG